MSEAPLHVQVIELIERFVEKRREEHRAKAGDGLVDLEYQRMVGRIRESTAILAELDRLKRSSLSDIENDDEDDEEDKRDERTARRSNRRARQTR